MDRIYLLSSSTYWEDLLDGFATTTDGLVGIATDHYQYTYFEPGTFRIVVDLKKFCVYVYEDEELYSKLTVFEVTRNPSD